VGRPSESPASRHRRHTTKPRVAQRTLGLRHTPHRKTPKGVSQCATTRSSKHGLQFNSVAVHNLFAWIGSQMNEYSAEEYKGNESHKWSAKKWRNYYDLCAAILQRKMVLR